MTTTPNGLDPALLAEFAPDLPGLLDAQAAARKKLSNARARHQYATLRFGNGELRPSRYEASFDQFDVADRVAADADADVTDRITSPEFQAELRGRLDQVEADMEQVLRRLGPPFDHADQADRDHAANEVRYQARSRWLPLARIAQWAHLPGAPAHSDMPPVVEELLRRCEGRDALWMPVNGFEGVTSGVEWGDGQFTSPIGPAMDNFWKEKQASLDALIGVEPEPPRNQRRIGFP